MDNIEEKAQQYASIMLDEDNIFFNYLRNQLVKAYLAGANEAIQSKAAIYPNTTQQYY